MDQDRGLYSNPDILNVFTNHHYEVHPTETDSSHQNGPVERAHRVIGDHALLIGANLDIKLWSYAFSQRLSIQNAIAMNGQNSSHIFQTTGKKENFSGFRTFVKLKPVLLPNTLLSLNTTSPNEYFLVSFLELSEASYGTTVKQATLDPLTALNSMKV